MLHAGGAIIYNGFTKLQVICMLSNATRMAVDMTDRTHQSDASADLKVITEESLLAAQEFNIEKLQLVGVEKKKIKQEYEKEKQVQVRKKIDYSMQLNASRLKVLQAQDDLVSAMKEAAAKELLLVSQKHHTYKHLLFRFASC